MVSIGPYNQSTNFTHMFDMNDLRGPLPLVHTRPNSLSDIILKEPTFSRFNYILQLAKLQPFYDDLAANFTVFVPSDASLKYIPESVFTNMDIGTARHIIKSSTLNRRITADILEDSPASYLLTQNPPNRLFVTNINGRTYIDNHINVLQKNIQANNGIIHIVDKLLFPIIV